MPVSVILFADVHYAKGLTACATRLCDRSLDKLARLAQRTKGALAYINLGDLINGRPDEQAVKSDLRAVREAISRLGAPCYSLVAITTRRTPREGRSPCGTRTAFPSSWPG